MVSQKHGISALGLQRVLRLGSYQTAWAMLHRYRAVMVRPGREQLGGLVEVDETWVGGIEEGKHGRDTESKSLVAIAVEIKQPKGFGRIRVQRVAGITKESLMPFLTGAVEPGATVHSDGNQAYWTVPDHGYQHRKTVLSRQHDPAHVVMPGAHRVASLLKRWLLGTTRAWLAPSTSMRTSTSSRSASTAANSRSRGMLSFRLMQLAVAAPPVTYRQLVVNPQPKRARPTAPRGRRDRPVSLAVPPAGRPWRETKI